MLKRSVGILGLAAASVTIGFTGLLIESHVKYHTPSITFCPDEFGGRRHSIIEYLGKMVNVDTKDLPDEEAACRLQEIIAEIATENRLGTGESLLNSVLDKQRGRALRKINEAFKRPVSSIVWRDSEGGPHTIDPDLFEAEITEFRKELKRQFVSYDDIYVRHSPSEMVRCTKNNTAHFAYDGISMRYTNDNPEKPRDITVLFRIRG